VIAADVCHDHRCPERDRISDSVAQRASNITPLRTDELAFLGCHGSLWVLTYRGSLNVVPCRGESRANVEDQRTAEDNQSELFNGRHCGAPRRIFAMAA
jgi:hypothetical protein